MADLNYFVQRMRYWCDEGNLGYDQSNRWDIRYGGECDCSSLVIHCLQEAGFDTGSASYTGDMSDNLTARGWKRFYPDGNPQFGDILLNDGNHVAVYVGNNLMSYASIDENGNARGGRSGDQTDRETKTVQYANYSRGWDCYLRWNQSNSNNANQTSAGKLEEDGWWGQATTCRLQEYLGTPEDGILDNQDIQFKNMNPGCLSSTFMWEEGYRGGSSCIKALQEKIGASIDGQIGPNTINRLQEYLGKGYGDGKLDGPSETVKRLQERLNNNTF